MSDLMNVSQVGAEEFLLHAVLQSDPPWGGSQTPYKNRPGSVSEHQHCAAPLLAGVNGPSPT